MEKKCGAFIHVWLPPALPKNPGTGSHEVGEESAVSAFLYEVASKWHQFWISNVSPKVVSLKGECTERERTALNEDIEAFFANTVLILPGTLGRRCTIYRICQITLPAVCWKKLWSSALRMTARFMIVLRTANLEDCSHLRGSKDGLYLPFL